MKRESKWTKSIAVGSEAFIEKTKNDLKGSARGRKLYKTGDTYELRESQTPYIAHFSPENSDIEPNNTYLWNEY